MTNYNIPLIDFHVHCEEGEGGLSLEEILALADKRNAKVGIVEHAGFGQSIGDDKALKRYVEKLAPYPVYKGIQAEGRDWPNAFTPNGLKELDFILTDVLTFPQKDGTVLQLWKPGIVVEYPEDFMERYVALAVQVLSHEPIDILANPTYLPQCLQPQYQILWTRKRMDALIDAARAHDVALEINARYHVPSEEFVRRAHRAGVKFTFGTNTHGAEVGELKYPLELARRIGLTAENLFMP